MHSIEFSREARNALKAMPRNLRELVLTKIDELAMDPMRARNVKKLVGARAIGFGWATGE